MDTTTKWAFLQPWLGALLDSLAHHNDDDDDEAQLIQADLDCWPEDLDEYSFDEPDFTVGEWNLFVDFPADDASRRDREGLQRIREAIELFNFLAVVDNKSFRTLLSDFVGAADSNCIVHPVWQCSLAGILPQGDPIAQRAEVTWGAIFGCPHDPWEYSPTFRDAMLKLEELDAECDDESDDEDYVGGINSSLHWFIQSEAVPMKGIQETKVYSASKSTCEDLSRKMGELFGLHAPPMARTALIMRHHAEVAQRATP
ncbi:uncharacterized protein IUM83_08814 [Phytophthora cinnamomi]|uniref:uncharacterized protein n=1 Tax=Phytophthora cinnamomi TaxID=4785 RepID=UPI00355A472E|nr:hypothetical protein IUM83_08814 [Phytophthora cinnamomi]